MFYLSDDEEEEGIGKVTPPLEPRWHELLAEAVGKDNTLAPAVSTHMNFEGPRSPQKKNSRQS